MAARRGSSPSSRNKITPIKKRSGPVGKKAAPAKKAAPKRKLAAASGKKSYDGYGTNNKGQKTYDGLPISGYPKASRKKIRDGAKIKKNTGAGTGAKAPRPKMKSDYNPPKAGVGVKASSKRYGSMKPSQQRKQKAAPMRSRSRRRPMG